MSDQHPAAHNLMAALSFNLTQLKDLEYICDLAAVSCSGTWNERSHKYRELFGKRAQELEAQLDCAAVTEVVELINQARKP